MGMRRLTLFYQYDRIVCETDGRVYRLVSVAAMVESVCPKIERHPVLEYHLVGDFAFHLLILDTGF